MYSALLRAGVKGQKPKTQFKEYNDILIATQPDLEDGENYYEFKTYPINDYARAQCKVFSYVLGKPVVLVDLKEDENSYINFKKEVIDEEAIVELRKLFNRTATSTRQLALTNLSNT
ncbi:MAG: hypothetical protein HA495_00305 [Thaumarchaeota archaeon]|nr:hypothetical protein [Nitrososphaerota archaeon]